MTSFAPSPQEILAHSAWMRRLAFDLVHEPGAADDVVQKAWLVALARGPAPGRSVRAWLAGVVRHLSSKERRASARRERREERGARPEAVPATGDVVARLELHQQALDALHALPEPYRRTLSLRYLEELDGAEIARREGVPPGTVRWRLAEGLARMRAELDRRHHGERGAPGTARVPAPGEPFQLLVSAPGYGAARTQTFLPQTPPASVLLELDPRPGVSGVVVADGKPIGSARVVLHALVERGASYALDSLRLRVRPQASAETSTDAEGRFTLALDLSGDFLLLARSDGWATAELGPLALVAGEGRAEFVVALDRGGAIEGRVRMPSGLSPEGVIVAVNRGDTFAQTQRVGADGAFRFEGLAAGPWEVRRVERMIGASHLFEMSAGERALEPDCHVELGGVTHHDLDLTDARACVVAGELAWGGRPARGWTVALWPLSGVVMGQPPSAVLDEGGAFLVRAQDPGEFRLQFRPPSGLGEWSDEIELVRGSNPFHGDVTTATLDVHRTGGEIGGLLLVSGGFTATLPSDPTTTLELPAGPLSIGRYEQASGLELARWSEVLALTLAPGERREIELP